MVDEREAQTLRRCGARVKLATSSGGAARGRDSSARGAGYFFFEDFFALDFFDEVFEAVDFFEAVDRDDFFDAVDFFAEDFFAEAFFAEDFFEGDRFTSPLSPWPGFTAFDDLERRSAASERPTSTTSLNFPPLSRRT